MDFHGVFEDIALVAGVLLTIASLLVLLWANVGRGVWRDHKANVEFQKQFRADWLGEAGRPGFPPRAGVMESLMEIRGGWAALNERIRKAELDLIRMRSEVTILHNRMLRAEECITTNHPDKVFPPFLTPTTPEGLEP